MSANSYKSSKTYLGPVLPGFEHVNRFVDRHEGYEVAKIIPGEYFITDRDMAIATVLGSCISACIRDKVFCIGGMNHFMLPVDKRESELSSEVISDAARYGSYAMEHMINDILKFGGHKKNLEIKIFGGARVISGMSDIGASNCRFIKNYLSTESLTAIASDLGGTNPRKVLYFPATGKVLVKKLKDMHNDTIAKREEKYRYELQHNPIEGEIELFN